jgi:hypothetical protein
MGATDFYTTAKGKTAEIAYRRANDEARSYSGHQEGYSGDIQTTSGFRLMPTTLFKGLRAKTRGRILELVAFGEGPRKGELYGKSLEAYRAVSHWNAAEKWGHCLAVEVRSGEFAFAGLAAC